MIVKVCGITQPADALHAVVHGATAIGFVFWPRSPRAITAGQAAAIVRELPPGITTVGVFVNESVDAIRRTIAESGITAVQLHGDEPPDYASQLECRLFRAVTLETAADACDAWPTAATLLLDAADPVRRGGTGQTVNWQEAAAIARRRPVVLAGGLTPDNVAGAIAAVRPFGVDVSSGVERAPGVKDPGRVAAFLASARGALAER